MKAIAVTPGARVVSLIEHQEPRLAGPTDVMLRMPGAPALVPGMTLDAMARHALDFWLTSEDLPDPHNRVTLTRDGAIKLSSTANNLEGHTRLVKRLKSMLKGIGCEDRLLPCMANALRVGDHLLARLR